MTTFLLDLWHDLREKRLWPVAILLAVALAAVPLVLRKPAEEPAPAIASAAPASPADADAEELAVKALQEGALPSSKLDTFSAKNPFKPLVKEPSVQDVADQLDQAQTGSAGDPGEAPAGGGSTGGGVPVGGDTGTVDPGDDGDNGDGDGDGDKPTTTNYAYVVDLTFTANERRRRIKGMQRLDILPSEANPLLLLLGVDDGGGNAVFLVDSTLTAAGEGSCRPSAEECAFVHLGPGSEHQFTNESGDSYTVRIDEIRRVKVPTKAASAKTARAQRPQAGASAGPSAPARRFAPRLLSDLVVVASGGADDSKSDPDHR